MTYPFVLLNLFWIIFFYYSILKVGNDMFSVHIIENAASIKT